MSSRSITIPELRLNVWNIPYIRVSDIVNWEMYRNPVAGITEDVWKSKLGNGKVAEAEDIIFVRRGSYRIGTVAMASPRDKKTLLTKELLTLRIIDRDNEHGITSFYLLAMLSSKVVQDQMKNLVFMDTTLPNIGDRWKSLIIPVHRDASAREAISSKTERAIKDKWAAQERIEDLRTELGGLTT